ncbi:hypothetical protein LguiB_017934 [Lonicera macranthoides]
MIQRWKGFAICSKSHSCNLFSCSPNFCMPDRYAKLGNRSGAKVSAKMENIKIPSSGAVTMPEDTFSQQCIGREVQNSQSLRTSNVRDKEILNENLSKPLKVDIPSVKHFKFSSEDPFVQFEELYAANPFPQNQPREEEPEPQVEHPNDPDDHMENIHIPEYATSINNQNRKVFTLDDVFPSQWREKMVSFSAWMKADRQYYDIPTVISRFMTGHDKCWIEKNADPIILFVSSWRRRVDATQELEVSLFTNSGIVLMRNNGELNKLKDQENCVGLRVELMEGRLSFGLCSMRKQILYKIGKRGRKLKRDNQHAAYSYSRWQNIQPDIMETIVKRLEATDLVRMSCVCNSWRQILVLHKDIWITAPDIPWLLLSHAPDCQSLSFYSMSECRFYNMKLPKKAQGGQICGYSKGWLAVVKGSNLNPHMFLLNPISGEQIKLPSLTTVNPYYSDFIVRRRAKHYNALNFVHRIEVFSGIGPFTVVSAIFGWSLLGFCKLGDKR